MDQHRLDAVVAELAEIAEVTEVCGMTGPTDLTVRVVAQDADDLYRIAGHILKIPGVERTNMALIMRSLVGPRAAPLLDRLIGANGESGTPGVNAGDDAARAVGGTGPSAGDRVPTPGP